ncbi:MAG TPA: hypothetical protein VH374_06370 [Polyangia bacterium]|nr:hypothetical protein [Polyangia bacterium]
MALGGVLSLVSSRARADQFMLFDAMFTYTWDDAENAKPDKSHFYVTEKNFLNKMRPTDMVTPVNYKDGTVHIRAEVIDKPPGGQMAGWALCYVDNAGHYGCPYTDYYTKVGVYERDADMHTFFQASTLQWQTGVKEVDLVYTINGSGSGHITNFPALMNLTTPTTVRITMVQVSMGAKYDPSIIPDTGSTPEPGVDGGAVKDASTDAPMASIDASTGGTSGGSGGSTMPPASGSGGDNGGGSGGSTTGGVSGGSTGNNTGAGGASGGNAPGVSTSSGCALGAGAPLGGAAPVGLFAFALGLLIRRQRRQ